MSFTLFGGAFGFQPLFQAQCSTLQEMTVVLRRLLSERGEVATRCRDINSLLATGTANARAITRELSLTLLRPVERDEINELNVAFLSAIKAVQAIAGRIGLYALAHLPAAAGDLAAELGELMAEVAAMLPLLTKGETGAEHAAAVARIRAEADEFLLLGLGELFERGEASPGGTLEVVKWSLLYDRLEGAIERVEHLGSVLEGILLKHA
jgi:uncharacterized protein